MRKHRFALGLFIYAVIMLLLIFAGLFVFWQYIASYEFSRVEGVMDDYMAEDLDENLDREIDRFAASHATVLETAEDIAASVRAAVDSGELSFRKTPGEYSADAPVYSVRLNKEDLGKVYFRSYSGGPLAFGFDYWFSNRSEFDFDSFEREYTIIAPAEAQLTVNGVALSSENCFVSWGTPEELVPYTRQLVQLPSQARYSFTACAKPQVALLPGSEDYWISEDESLPGVFTVTQMCTTELSAQLHQYAEDFVRAYIAYTSNSTSHAAVTGYTVYNGPLYQRMVASAEGMSWVHGVTSTMSDLTVDSLQYYGCAATVVAHYSLDTRGEISDNNMKIVLTQTGQGWRVAEIELF